MTNFHSIETYRSILNKPVDLFSEQVEPKRVERSILINMILELGKRTLFKACQLSPVYLKPLFRQLWLRTAHARDMSFIPSDWLLLTKNTQSLSTQSLLSVPDFEAKIIGSEFKSDGTYHCSFNYPNKKYDFFNYRGNCLGGTKWSIHLYFQSKDLFSNTESQMKAIAKQFCQGVPEQGVILQTFDQNHQFSKVFLNLSFSDRNTFDVKKSQELIEYVEKLYEGVYYISIEDGKNASHAITLVKAEDGYFLLDLNYGLKKVSPEDLVKHFLSYNTFFDVEGVCINKVNQEGKGEAFLIPQSINLASQEILESIPISNKMRFEFYFLITQGHIKAGYFVNPNYSGSMTAFQVKELVILGKTAILAADPNFDEDILKELDQKIKELNL